MTDHEITFTLLSDGSSDKVLLPILQWLLREHFPEYAFQAQWADLGRLRNPPKPLAEKIAKAIDYYPCQLLFVHRDAEKQPPEMRTEEINQALDEIRSQVADVPTTVHVIPVRMQEAWLLIDEQAIRIAVDNPNGRMRLALPALAQLERIPDPKKTLYDLLTLASGLSKRRNFRPEVHVHRVPAYIDDFSPLRELSAFIQLETSIKALVFS